MRQLRFVRQGEDPDHAICENADGGEQFVLLIDRAMRDALRADLPRLPHVETEQEREAAISPREIQMRVRAGESPEDVAADAGMPLDKVMRFASAVLQERARIADTARHSRARRTSGDGQAVEFGPAVDARFEAHGIDSSAVQWGAYRGAPSDSGQWVVVAQWMGGDSERQAEWSYQLSSRTITPLDDAATDLLSDKPIRAVVPQPAPAPEPQVRFPAMPEARTGPLPRVEPVFDQEAPDPDAPRVGPDGAPPLVLDTSRLLSSFQHVQATAPAPAAPDPSSPDPSSPDPSSPDPSSPDPSGPDFQAPEFHLPAFDVPEFEAPPLPLHVAGAPQPDAFAHLRPVKRDESDEERAERARIPSWDDILLGVRRKQD